MECADASECQVISFNLLNFFFACLFVLFCFILLCLDLWLKGFIGILLVFRENVNERMYSLSG